MVGPRSQAMTQTSLERPGRPARTYTQTGSVDVDDLPSGPPPSPRAPDMIAIVRYQLHRVEAQATSLGRELVASRASERALHLVTATINAARTALRVIEQG